VSSIGTIDGAVVCNIRGEERTECQGVNARQVPNLHLINNLLDGISGRGQDLEEETAAESFQFGRHAYNEDPWYGLIQDGLNRLLADETAVFVVFSDEMRGRFVQFLKFGAEGIMLDIPIQQLGSEELDLAKAFLAAFDADLVAVSTGGVRSFQIDFMLSDDGIDRATAVAVGLFRDVFLIVEPGSLSVKIGR
jgi:hypothetical protein